MHVFAKTHTDRHMHKTPQTSFLKLLFSSLCGMFITSLQIVSPNDHKISSNFTVATPIRLAMKMAASVHCECQIVCLMANSSAKASVSSQREAASIFPIVPNEISITNMQIYRYFHRFLATRANTGWQHAEILHQYVQYM